MQRSLIFILITLCILVTFSPVNAGEEAGGAYYDFGVFAYEDGDFKDAVNNFKKALGLNPDNPFYNHYLGKTYLKMEHYQEAENYLGIAWKKNPDISGLKYDLAFLNYKISNYSKAADLFKETAKEDPSNILAHYYAGISLYKKKRFGKALGFFITASEKSPGIKANGFYYAGICYLKTGEFEKAVEKFEYVRDHAEAASLRESAAKWISVVDKHKKALKPLSLFLKLGYQYDDNVRLEPLDEDMYADEDDFAGIAYFSGNYNFINRQALKIGAGYIHYQTWYLDLDDYDLIGSTLNLYAKYRLPPFTFSLGYLPSYYWVDDDDYMRRHQFKPELSWQINENLFTRLYYRYSDNKNFQDDNRTGHSNDVFLDAYYFFMDKKWRIFGGVGYKDNEASHPDYDYGQFKTKLGASFKLPWSLDIVLTGKYHEKNYDSNDSFFGAKRKDRKYYGTISLSRKLFYEWLGIVAEYNYTKNNSNIDDYEYDKNTATLSLTARY